ncbi:MAG: collagen-binding protein [Cyclobacteriaceae bacterium]|nr:MAG: collagen-binding protein [Cyclobacteriaceae bacterium]
MRYIFLFFLPWAIVHAQPERATLSGYVRDASNGEALIGATVFVPASGAGTVANAYGFYSLTLARGIYQVRFSFVGYTDVVCEVDLSRNTRLDIELTASSTQLDEVVISSKEEEAAIRSIQMSVNRLNAATIARMPAFLGEADIIKSIQQLPGVSTVGEGASGYNVRGGSVGQNLIVLDEAAVYNPSHLLGFFSVFNPDAIKDVQLYKGGIPARYGGRLASILDVRMKEGNSKQFEANGGIGTIFSRLTVEGPLVPGKASFILAARRSYIDVLARPFVDVLRDGARLNFYDLTAKLNYRLNEHNNLFLSGYAGRDIFFFDRQQGFSWGNATGTLRWNSIIGNRLFSNVSLIFSKYDYALQFGEDERDNFKWNSSVTDFTVKPSLSYFINSQNEISAGVEAHYYQFDPARATGTTNGETVNISLDRKYNLETSFYVSHQLQVSRHTSAEYGLRYSIFQGFGPGRVYQYNDTIPGIRRQPVSFTDYAKGVELVRYATPEPRISLKYEFNPRSSVKASFMRMAQYLHLISNTAASNPLDVWAPSSQNIKPQLGTQVAMGYFRTLGQEKSYELSAEVYYRSTRNQVDYIDGADLLINEYLEGDLLSGRGRAYGMELYMQKKTGRLTGWVSYTLARTELKVNGINNGSWYPTRFDQTHNFKATAFYQINNRWSASANFTFLSGTPTTFPTSRYVIQDILIPHNAANTRNNVRIPPFHRLDVSFRLEGRSQRKNGKTRKNTDYWVFGVYNLYARKNPFSVYFSQADDRAASGAPLQSRATQLSIIGTLVPSVSYNFHF